METKDKDNDATQIMKNSNDATVIKNNDETTQLIDSNPRPKEEKPEVNNLFHKTLPSGQGKQKRKTIKKTAGYAGAGILLGVSSALAVDLKGIDASETKSERDEESVESIEIEGDLQEITIHDDGIVRDDMTFEEAFSAAREAYGTGSVFEWRGKVYATYTKEEWENLTDEEKSNFMGSLHMSEAGVSSDDERPAEEVSVTATESSETDVTSESVESEEEVEETLTANPINEEASDSTDDTSESSTANTDETILAQVANFASNEEIHSENITDGDILIVTEGSGNESESDVEVLGVVHDQESGQTTGHLNVVGEDVYVIDVNGDMVFDTIVADLNHDGVIDDNEIMDISESGLTVEDLGGLTNLEDGLMASNDDAPDYLAELLD